MQHHRLHGRQHDPDVHYARPGEDRGRDTEYPTNHQIIDFLTQIYPIETITTLNTQSLRFEYENRKPEFERYMQEKTARRMNPDSRSGSTAPSRSSSSQSQEVNHEELAAKLRSLDLSAIDKLKRMADEIRLPRPEARQARQPERDWGRPDQRRGMSAEPRISHPRAAVRGKSAEPRAMQQPDSDWGMQYWQESMRPPAPVAEMQYDQQSMQYQAPADDMQYPQAQYQERPPPPETSTVERFLKLFADTTGIHPVDSSATSHPPQVDALRTPAPARGSGRGFRFPQQAKPVRENAQPFPFRFAKPPFPERFLQQHGNSGLQATAEEPIQNPEGHEGNGPARRSLIPNLYDLVCKHMFGSMPNVDPRIPEGTRKVFHNVGNTLNVITSSMGTAYDEYPEVHNTINGGVLFGCLLLASTVLLTSLGLWFYMFKSMDIDIELVKNLTLVVMMTALRMRRTPIFLMLALGVSASVLMHYSYMVTSSNIIQLQPTELSNARVYGALENCLRDNKQLPQTVVTGFILLSKVIDECVVEKTENGVYGNALSMRCEQVLYDAQRSVKDFNKCTLGVIQDRSIVSREKVYSSYYGPDGEKKAVTFDYLDALSSFNPRVSYFFLTARLNKGYWWSKEKRLETLLSLWTEKSSDQWYEIINYWRKYCGLFGAETAVVSTYVGLMVDVYKWFRTQNSYLSSLVTLIPYVFKPYQLAGYENIKTNHVSIAEIDFPPSGYERSEVASDVARHQNISLYVQLDNRHFVTLGAPRRQSLPNMNREGLKDKPHCPSLEKLKTYTWDFPSCPTVAQAFVAVLERYYDSSNPMFCPRYCHDTVMMARDDRTVNDINGELKQCRDNLAFENSKSETIESSCKKELNAMEYQCNVNITEMQNKLRQKQECTFTNNNNAGPGNGDSQARNRHDKTPRFRPPNPETQIRDDRNPRYGRPIPVTVSDFTMERDAEFETQSSESDAQEAEALRQESNTQIFVFVVLIVLVLGIISKICLDCRSAMSGGKQAAPPAGVTAPGAASPADVTGRGRDVRRVRIDAQATPPAADDNWDLLSIASATLAGMGYRSKAERDNERRLLGNGGKQQTLYWLVDSGNYLPSPQRVANNRAVRASTAAARQQYV